MTDCLKVFMGCSDVGSPVKRSRQLFVGGIGTLLKTETELH